MQDQLQQSRQLQQERMNWWDNAYWRPLCSADENYHHYCLAIPQYFGPSIASQRWETSPRYWQQPLEDFFPIEVGQQEQSEEQSDVQPSQRAQEDQSQLLEQAVQVQDEQQIPSPDLRPQHQEEVYLCLGFSALQLPQSHLNTYNLCWLALQRLDEDDGDADLLEQDMLEYIARFEGIRAAHPNDFRLAELIVRALVGILQDISDLDSMTVAHFEVCERLKDKYGVEICEYPNDVVRLYAEEIEEIFEAAGEEQSTRGSVESLLIKVANIKAAEDVSTMNR